MVWSHQATRYYLIQCWPRFILPFDITRPESIKPLKPSTCNTIWHHRFGSTSDQVLVYIKASSYSNYLNRYCQLSTWPLRTIISVKLESKYNNFNSKKFILKCLQNNANVSRAKFINVIALYLNFYILLGTTISIIVCGGSWVSDNKPQGQGRNTRACSVLWCGARGKEVPISHFGLCHSGKYRLTEVTEQVLTAYELSHQ